MPADMTRQLRLAGATLAVVAATLGGCSPVPSYGWGKLAHPTMARGSISTMGEEHLRAISEGAVGTTSGAGSGCGCN